MAVVSFLIGILGVYDIFAFFLFLIFVLLSIGTTYTVFEGLNHTSFKLDKFWLLIASSVVLAVYTLFMMLILSRILFQFSLNLLPSFLLQ
ncbi:hypothetical protein STRDD10_00807 [Streptococcus sp. DD10]|nr:hypothetical protein STRDD10_00807 [Streptococcus sp. DD10]